MSTTTTYYLVYRDEQAPADRPWGLYRRVYEDGRVVAEDSYHPRTGWSQTNYWMAIAFKGESERHLVEVDEQRAVQAQEAFIALHNQP